MCIRAPGRTKKHVTHNMAFEIENLYRVEV